MAMVSQLTTASERTKVAEVTSWIPDSAINSLFLMFDVGGHDSYKNTAHVFQVVFSQMHEFLDLDIQCTNY